MATNCSLIKILLLSVLFVSTKGIHSFAQEPERKETSVNFFKEGLRVSDNRRFLIHENGEPFYYLGDTAWELFHRLNEEEVALYFENRRQKGFTVIYAVILAELDGLNTPNANGDKPLLDNNPLSPNERYFAWVDKVIRMAEEKGLYMALLPTWGDKVTLKWGIGPVIFNEVNAFAYGTYLSRRYKDFPNIIWVNGGDRSGGEDFPVWEALAEAIRKEDKNCLMTFHPFGEASSSQWFHCSDWLDFNSCQTGHSQDDYQIFRELLVRDYDRIPVKPCLDAEPRYEDIPFNFEEKNRRFDDADVRQALYGGLFSGAFGFVYGCNDIWQFYTQERKPVCFARNNWKKALDAPGAWNVIHARRLLEQFDYLSRVPDQDIILTPQKEDRDKALATRGKDYAWVYFPNGRCLELALTTIPGASQLSLEWFNPRTGEIQATTTVAAQGVYQASPPTSGRGNDWILIMKRIN